MVSHSFEWRDVLFARKSGHVRCTPSSLLWANSGHYTPTKRNRKTASRRSLQNEIRGSGGKYNVYRIVVTSCIPARN